jgi:mono/diheme cytochrome c family protein
MLILMMVMAACGGGGEEAVAGGLIGDPIQGEELYKLATIGSAGAPGCVACHSLEPGVTLAGPSHAEIGTKAKSAVAGLSAAEYLRESIVDPDAAVIAGFPAGRMYRSYGSVLTEQEIADLVAFLMTLK